MIPHCMLLGAPVLDACRPCAAGSLIRIILLWQGMRWIDISKNPKPNILKVRWRRATVAGPATFAGKSLNLR
jgi:hypothetical protein